MSMVMARRMVRSMVEKSARRANGLYLSACLILGANETLWWAALA